MSYIENIYICLAAPLLLAILCLKGNWRRALSFLLSGMTCCLCSAYISSFFAGISGISSGVALHAISPAVEEIVKFLPVLFYILLFEPKKDDSISGIILVAVGFATFENVCFLTSYGTSELIRLIIRGFGTGAMHVFCGVLLSVGIFYLWDRTDLRILGVFAVLCSAITFHAIFNIMVSSPGISTWIGSAVPLTLILCILIFFSQSIDMFPAEK